jgi:hypothetical protein
VRTCANEPAKKCKTKQNNEDLDNITPMVQSEVRLYITTGDGHFLLLGSVLSLDGAGQVGREAPGFKVVIHKLVFFGPASAKPFVKFLLVVEGDVCDGEASPVHVDRGWWAAAHVCRAEGEVLVRIDSLPVG